MTDLHSSTETPAFSIGIVARRTGIHPETLRMWQRRYGLVDPSRSAGGSRLYTEADVQRLILVKRLVDAGHPIRLVAPLPVAVLETRLASTPATTPAAPAPATACPVSVVGPSLPARIAQAPQDFADLRVTGRWADPARLAAESPALEGTVLLVEYEALQADTAEELLQLLHVSGAMAAVVVYGFAARPALRSLELAGVSCLQAPVTAAAIRRACLESREQPATAQPPAAAIAPRRFTPEQLSRVAGLSPSLACECPHHLAGLVSSLGAFETYSAQCRNRSPQDAQLHEMLLATAAQARAQLELALERVLEHESIRL